jgi:hypothetical protein
MSSSFYGISEQDKASQCRLEDAHALAAAQRWRGAMYMAGYGVECLLKSRLMHMYGCKHLTALDRELERRGLLRPPASVFTHHLESLLRLINGFDRLRQNHEYWRLFNLVNRWVPAWRYAPDQSSPRDAVAFLAAVEKLCHWIRNNT